MSAKNKGSKNDAKNRGASAQVKKYNNKPVEPIKFYSQGKVLIAAKFTGTSDIVLDENKNPVPYNSINEY